MSLFVPQSPTAPTVPDPASSSQGKPKPGFSDALGDRHIQRDDALEATVEVLKFKHEFGGAASFEAALRKRVDDLRRLLHPSLPTLRGVDRLSDGTLALISDHVPGRRLSEILQTVRGPVFAVELIRQLTPAVASIQRPDPQLSHGLITADRIIVTREGRLVIVEHALGSAMESLKLSADQLKATFGLAVQDVPGPVRLDQRLDVIQLGFVALTLLLGRRLDPNAFRVGIPALLDEFSEASPRDAAALRPWFERALQMGERPFETAEDALDAIEELPEQEELAQKGPQRSILMFKNPSGESSPLRAVPAPDRSAAPAAPSEPASPAEKIESPSRDVSAIDVPAPAPEGSAPELAYQDDEDPRFQETETDDMAATARTSRKMMWVAAGFAVLSAAQAAVIVMMLMRQSPDLMPTAAAAPRETAPAAPAPEPVAPVPPPATPAPAPAAAAATKPADDDAAETPLGGRIGGVRVTAPVELQVFQDGSLLGTTAGPIALSEGTHTLEFVNEGLGYRTRQTVSVKAGQLAAVKLTLPQGRININATPWANVWIDGNAAGETPIANLTLPIGTHEIVFRHPQLGEQRQTATVKADGVARVSAAFAR
jgi:hypothetical protein